MRAAGLPTLFLELMFSYVLIFCADDAFSQRTGKAMLNSDYELIKMYQKRYAPSHADFGLHHFPIYASRLRYVIQKMDDWRPQSILQLAVRPYKDPLSFYAFWFATVIGTVSFLALGAAFAQTYAVFRAIPPDS